MNKVKLSYVRPHLDFETYLGTAGWTYSEVHAHCKETSQSTLHERCFPQVDFVALCPFLTCETMSSLQGAKCRCWHASVHADSNLQLSSTFARAEALAHRAIVHGQRLTRPLLVDDNRVHFKNEAWENQKDTAAGKLHETYTKA